MLEKIQTLDEMILTRIGIDLRAEWLDPLMVVYTALGNGGLAFIVLAILLLLFRKTRRAGASAAIALAAGAVCTNLIFKPLVSRPRPWIAMEGWETLVTSSDMHSFPSGHTTAAFAFAVALCAVLPQKWAKAAALIAAALMGFSRLYVGAHFPTDVLAGAVVGVLCGLAGVWLSGKIMVRFTGRKAAG